MDLLNGLISAAKARRRRAARRRHCATRARRAPTLERRATTPTARDQCRARAAPLLQQRRSRPIPIRRAQAAAAASRATTSLRQTRLNANCSRFFPNSRHFGHIFKDVCALAASESCPGSLGERRFGGDEPVELRVARRDARPPQRRVRLRRRDEGEAQPPQGPHRLRSRPRLFLTIFDMLFKILDFFSRFAANEVEIEMRARLEGFLIEK